MNKAILLVDDDNRLRDLLKDYLSEKNLKVYTCQDFTEAQEVLKFFTFNLILLDRMMPSGNGVDLSNTYIHEKKFLWKGIICEPVKESQKKIKKVRKAILEKRPISQFSKKNVNFFKIMMSLVRLQPLTYLGHL